MRLRRYKRLDPLLAVSGVLGIFYLGLVLFEIGLRTTYLASMPQDLFFELDGVYRMSVGQKIYTDFSAVLGLFSYLLPLEFLRFGANPVLSVNYANGFLIAAAFPIVIYILRTRLSPLFGLLFGLWIGLALAARMNFGDAATSVAVAMNYNRQADAALAMALLLFRPSRGGAGRDALLDGVVYAVLTGFALYTKITFGLAALAFAPIVLGANRRGLAALGAFAAALALFVAGVEFGYGARFQWIGQVRMAAASTGPLGTTLAGTFLTLLENLPELLVCTLTPAFILWRDRRLTPVTIVFFVMVAGASAALLKENGQRYYLFLPAVLLFIAAPAAGPSGSKPSPAGAGAPEARWSEGLTLVTIAVLALGSGPEVVNLLYVGYRLHSLTPMVASNDVLRRIAIRADEPTTGAARRTASVVEGRTGALDAWSTARTFKPEHPFDALTMLEYRDYLVDGMRAAREGCSPRARILTLDIGNPFPLLLGWPPGGGMLVIHPGHILSKGAHPSEQAMFRDITCVLVPKLPVKIEAREFMFDVYGPYLKSRYRQVHETALWTVLRAPADLSVASLPAVSGAAARLGRPGRAGARLGLQR